LEPGQLQFPAEQGAGKGLLEPGKYTIPREGSHGEGLLDVSRVDYPQGSQSVENQQVAAEEAVQADEVMAQASSGQGSIRFNVTSTGESQVVVVDPNTQEVLRQVPGNDFSDNLSTPATPPPTGPDFSKMALAGLKGSDPVTTTGSNLQASEFFVSPTPGGSLDLEA